MIQDNLKINSCFDRIDDAVVKRRKRDIQKTSNEKNWWWLSNVKKVSLVLPLRTISLFIDKKPPPGNDCSSIGRCWVIQFCIRLCRGFDCGKQNRKEQNKEGQSWNQCCSCATNQTWGLSKRRLRRSKFKGRFGSLKKSQKQTAKRKTSVCFPNRKESMHPKVAGQFEQKWEGAKTGGGTQIARWENEQEQIF